MKTLLKTFLGLAAGNTVSFKLLRCFNRKKLLIIYYHRVVERRELANIKEKNMCVDIDNFNAQMKFLGKHYKPISEGEALKSFEKGHTVLRNTIG